MKSIIPLVLIFFFLSCKKEELYIPVEEKQDTIPSVDLDTFRVVEDFYNSGNWEYHSAYQNKPTGRIKEIYSPPLAIRSSGEYHSYKKEYITGIDLYNAKLIQFSVDISVFKGIDNNARMKIWLGERLLEIALVGFPKSTLTISIEDNQLNMRYTNRSTPKILFPQNWPWYLQASSESDYYFQYRPKYREQYPLPKIPNGVITIEFTTPEKNIRKYLPIAHIFVYGFDLLVVG